MKIDTLLSPLTGTSTSKKTVTPKSSGTPEGGSVKAAAYTVTLSALATDPEAAMESDDIRRERVDAIRAQLAEGSYNISGRDVAEKMLKALLG